MRTASAISATIVLILAMLTKMISTAMALGMFAIPIRIATGMVSRMTRTIVRTWRIPDRTTAIMTAWAMNAMTTSTEMVYLTRAITVLTSTIWISVILIPVSFNGFLHDKI